MSHILLLLSDLIGKVVVRLPQNTLNITLNFATLFQCAIKPLKSKSQREAVNALLINPGAHYISNAASSNYTTGKRVVPDDYRSTLASLSDEELTRRLTYIGIFEYDRMCEALLRLVKCAKLPSKQRDRLIDIYYNSGQMEFIKKTVRAAADCKEVTQLNNADIELLAEFSIVKSTAGSDDDELIIATEAMPDAAAGYPLSAQKSEDKYNHDWIRDYISQNMEEEEIRNKDFFGSPIVASQHDLNMPYDFPKLLCFLTPMVKGNPIDDFTVEEFMELMSISNSNVTAGSIECLKLTGPAKGVIKFILRHNMSDVSDVAFLMAGKVTNRDAIAIENAIRSVSNNNVNCIHAMWYDEEIPELEVTLITHVYAEKAQLQSTYKIDKDGVKVRSFRSKE